MSSLDAVGAGCVVGGALLAYAGRRMLKSVQPEPADTRFVRFIPWLFSKEGLLNMAGGLFLLFGLILAGVLGPMFLLARRL